MIFKFVFSIRENVHITITKIKYHSGTENILTGGSLQVFS